MTVEHNTLAGTSLHESFHYVQTSDPGSVGAGKYWLNTTSAPYVLSRRDAGNTSWITVGSTGGGGASVGAYGSRPAGSDGDFYQANDSAIYSIHSGGNWIDYYQGHPITVPNSGSYAWVNQGGAAVATVGGMTKLTAPATGAANNMRIRKKAVPSTPYTVVGKFLIGQFLAQNYHQFGMLFRDSGSSKLVVNQVSNDSTGALAIVSNKMTNETTFSAAYSGSVANFKSYGAIVTPGSILTLGLMDDGSTNRKVGYSFDCGLTWYAFDSETRTDFLTANEVGFWAQSGGAANDCVIYLLSWEEYNSALF